MVMVAVKMQDLSAGWASVSYSRAVNVENE